MPKGVMGEDAVLLGWERVLHCDAKWPDMVPGQKKRWHPNDSSKEGETDEK